MKDANATFLKEMFFYWEQLTQAWVLLILKVIGDIGRIHLFLGISVSCKARMVA